MANSAQTKGLDEKTPLQAIQDFLTDLGQREGVIEGVLSDNTGLPVGATISPNAEKLAAWASIILSLSEELARSLQQHCPATKEKPIEPVKYVQINQRSGVKTLMIPHEDFILTVSIHGVIKSKLGGKRRTARKLSAEKFKKAKEMKEKGQTANSN